MLTIQPQYLTLSKLFDGRLFRVPEYQRAYSWESHQRKDLFDDIIKLSEQEADEGHFMAAVVSLRAPKKQRLGTDDYDVLDIVDGQQRLTTLIILLAAIRFALSGEVPAEAKLRRELDELLVKQESNELLLLQTNHDSSHHFATYLRQGKSHESKSAKTLADRQLLLAIEESREFIKSWRKAGRAILDLAALLKNRLFFLLHEVNDEKMVYTVFEVLNSRGLPVIALDRLKSILMGAAFDLKGVNREGLIRDLHNTWRDVYRIIGLRQGMSTEALRFAATLRTPLAPSRPLGENDAVDALRDQANSAKTIQDVAHWLHQVAEACDKLVENKRIDAVTRIAQARLLAAAILLRNDLSEAERDRLLARWEKVSFRIYGLLEYDARTGVGDYVRLAWNVVNGTLTVDQIDAAIREIGSDYSIDDLVSSLRGGNWYEGSENELRYVMYRREEFLARQKKMNFTNEQWEKIWMASPSESIEHIWAKSKAPEKQRHRLGNLVMLPPRLNSTLQDLDPKNKASEYRKTGLLIAGEVAGMIESDSWNKKAIEAREESLLKWIAQEWSDA